MCVTVGRSDMSKFTEGSWQGSFTVINERSVRTLEPSSEQKNALRKFLQSQKLPAGFPASSNIMQMYYCVFCNLADSSRVKTNEEIITLFSIKKKKKNYTHVAIQVQAFR